MDPALQTFLTVIGGFLAGSTGFWVYLKNRYKHLDARLALIMGLAHDRIVTLGISYIEKGYVTKDEYEDLIKYFWEPYRDLEGNGTAERIMKMVQTLPLKPELRELPKIREAADRLHEGAEQVIKQVEKGDDRFERNPDAY